MTEKDFLGTPLIELIFNIWEKFYAISKNGESSENLSSINCLFICLLENGKGKAEHLLGRILSLCVKPLLQSKKKYE